jgi:hypothetical protein
VDGAGGVDVGVSAVRSTATDVVLVGWSHVARVYSYLRVSVDPLEPVLRTVASSEVLEIIHSGNSLGLGSPEEVILDGVSGLCSASGDSSGKRGNSRVVSERNLNGTLSSVDLTVLRSSLVGLMLPHERKEFLSGPALSLEVIIYRRVSHGTWKLPARTFNLQSDALARVYIIKLIDEPPPRM